jgi:cytidine deaminase
MNIRRLLEEARRYRDNAVAPLSGFRVGAALETAGGSVFGGCNVENATLGLTVCAERVAIWKALSEGETRFRRLVIVADTDSVTGPCGACRQIIWEYCGDIEVVLSNLQGRRATYRMRDLLPLPFDRRLLDEDAASRSRYGKPGD